jgi:hypothetical protein
MPRHVHVLAVVSLVAPAQTRAQDLTASLRAGVYSDSDYTTVLRSLIAAGAHISKWHIDAREVIDVVSSASIDVRSASGGSAAMKPLRVDAVTAASRPPTGPVTSSGGGTPEPTVWMSDRRYETVLGGGYDDGAGHVAGMTLVYATENDYRSVGAGATGAWDLEGRNTTFLAGGRMHHDTILNVLDPLFEKTSNTVGVTCGLAQVLGVGDVVRLRYDGELVQGYQASPYRTVRFGDWTTHLNLDGTLTFSNTIGSAAGLPEQLPSTRVRHALVGQWVHGFIAGVGLASEVRLARDSWGLLSGNVGAQLRAIGEQWTLVAGYRFYVQSRADFFADQYVGAPGSYTYYTSDKSLGSERDHQLSVDVANATPDWPVDGMKTVIDGKIAYTHFDYPGFTLLESRGSWFIELGLTLSY